MLFSDVRPVTSVCFLSEISIVNQSEGGIPHAENLFSIYLTFLECAIIVEEEGAERDEKKLSERHQPGTI